MKIQTIMHSVLFAGLCSFLLFSRTPNMEKTAVLEANLGVHCCIDPNCDDCNIAELEGRIPTMVTSKGSHQEPDLLKRSPNFLFQYPADRPIEILTGIQFDEKLAPYAVGKVLQDVQVSVDFFDQKGKLFNKTGQKPMFSVAFYGKSKEITQKYDERISFQQLSPNEFGAFLLRPDFGELKFSDSLKGIMVINFSAKDVNGKRQIIATEKFDVQFAVPELFEQLNKD